MINEINANLKSLIIMKKTTFKISTFLILALFVLQAHAQPVSVIVEGTKYNIKNFKTNDYLKANGTGAYEFSATLPTDDVTFNFTLNHHNTTDPGDGTVHNYLNDWNIGNDVRGIMRANGTATVHTTFQYNSWNSNGGHKTDKRWEHSTLEQTGITTFRFSPLNDGTTDRFLYQGDDGVLYNYAVGDMPDADRSYWVLTESTITLSNEAFDISSIFISNPVSNELSIKGLGSNVKHVSIFSLLGQEVLSNDVNSQSVNLDVSALDRGMYLVKLSSDKGSFTKKIVKQ